MERRESRISRDDTKVQPRRGEIAGTKWFYHACGDSYAIIVIQILRIEVIIVTELQISKTARLGFRQKSIIDFSVLYFPQHKLQYYTSDREIPTTAMSSPISCIEFRIVEGFSS